MNNESLTAALRRSATVNTKVQIFPCHIDIISSGYTSSDEMDGEMTAVVLELWGAVILFPIMAIIITFLQQSITLPFSTPSLSLVSFCLFEDSQPNWSEH